MSIPKPFAHQRQSVRFLGDHARALDWSDCGTGKTRVEIDAFNQFGTKCALVLAPKSILEPAWLEDITTFGGGMRASVAYAENRAEAFAANADIYVTNHDATKWLAQQSPKFFDRFSTLIIDEESAYKHRTSQRSKALAKIARYFAVRRGMTATPNGNTICDVWHQAYVIDDGRRLGKSFFAFRSEVCTPTQVGPQPNMVEWADREGAEVAVTGLLQDILIRHELVKCTDIPPNHIYERKYQLRPKHMATYRQLEKDSIVLIDLKTINAINGAVLANKLLQVASGAVYDVEGNYVLLDAGRYELVLDLVEEQRQSVVFFQWQHQKDELVKAANKRGVDFAVLDGSVTNIHTRNEIVRNFQRGFYRTLFIHPQTGAHGLTLTSATRTIWASPTYNQELFHQGIKRIHRAGQREVTETIVVIAPGTYDEVAYASCQVKGKRMYGLLDLVAA